MHPDEPGGWIDEAKSIHRRFGANDIRATLQMLNLHRIGSQPPPIDVIGLQHLERALAQEKGVVLWIGHTVFAGLIAKIGLKEAGFAIRHLSHPRHGFSETRFGVKVLNPIRWRVENRYLEERVLLGLSSSTSAIRNIRKQLKNNNIVSFTGSERATFPVEISVLGGESVLAPGAADLAYASGAILLPVFALEHETGRFAVSIEAPIDIPREMDRRAFAKKACIEFGERLTKRVAENPDQWLGWRYTSPGK